MSQAELELLKLKAKAKARSSAKTSDGSSDRQILGPLYQEPSGQTYLDFYKGQEQPDPGRPLGGPLELAANTVGGAVQSVGNLAGAVAGGLRNAAVGIATAPADIISALGSDKYQPLAEGMRNYVPEIRQPNAASELVQTGTQYIPAALYGGGLAQTATRTAAPWVQTTASMLGASLADMLATVPEQASTLGDFFGFGPTAINPEDSNMTKRVKVGAETAFAEPLVKGVMYSASKAKDVATTAKNTFWPSAKNTAQAAAETLQNVTANPQKAVANIEQVQAEYGSDPNFKPLMGDASADPGLARVQKTLKNRNPAMANQQLANQDTLAQDYKNVLEPSGQDNTGALRSAMESDIQARVAPQEEQLASLTKQLDDVDTELQNIAQDTARAKGMKVPASEAMYTEFRNVDDKLTQAKNALYDVVDPNGALVKDAGDFVDKITAIEKRPLQSADAVPSDIIGDVGKLVDPETGVSQISFRDLVDMRQRVSDAIGIARREGKGATIKNLMPIKQMVDDEIATFGAQIGPENTQAVGRLAAAQDNYANVFAPTLKTGVAGKFRDQIRGPLPPAPSTTGARFISGTSGQKERVASLTRVLENADNPAQAKAAVRDYAISDMAETVVSGSKIRLESLDDWIESNAELLKQYPDIQREVAQLRNRVSSGSTAKKALELDIENQAKTLAQTQKEVAASPQNTVLASENQVEAVGKVLAGNNARQKMRQLITTAKKDTSGKALQGLKDAVKQWNYNRLTQKGVTFSGGADNVRKLSFANLVDAETGNKDLMSILEDIYGAGSKEIQVLRQGRKKLEILTRSDRLGESAGSITQPLKQTEADFESVLSLAVSNNFRQYRIFNIVFGNLNNPTQAVEKMLADAMVDPELMKTLLLKPIPKNIPKVTANLRTYVANNILGDDENSAKKNQKP